MVNVHFIYALLIQCNYTQKIIIFTIFYYNAFPMHVHNYMYAIFSGLRLHVLKFCKRLPAKHETLPFTRVIVSPLVETIENHNTWISTN